MDYHHSGDGELLELQNSLVTHSVESNEFFKNLLSSSQSIFFLVILVLSLLHNIVTDRICFWKCAVHEADYLLFLQEKSS